MTWQPNAVNQYNLGTTNTDFKMFGIQTNFAISTARMLFFFFFFFFFLQIMYLPFKLTIYWTWRSTKFPCFTLVFPVLCHVAVLLLQLYYINTITLIIRVIRLRLSNAIRGSNFGERKCMRLKKQTNKSNNKKNNWFPALSRYKKYLWICYLKNLEWFLQFHGHIKMDISNRFAVRLDRIKMFICIYYVILLG